MGFYKVVSGKPSVTWPEAVDEALCYGWIDGIRKSLGEQSYTIRFTPRRPDSFWSNKNIASARRLTIRFMFALKRALAPLGARA